MKEQLQGMLWECANLTFQHDLGNVVQALRGTSAAFEATQVPRKVVKLERQIGQGQSGEVWLGELTAAPSWGKEPGTPVAVKLSKAQEGDAQVHILLEARMMHLLPHPFLIRMLAMVTVDFPVLLCMEYMEGGDLKTFLRACRPTLEHPRMVVTGDDFVRMAGQVAGALAFLEERRIVHRDVAARNVLVNKDASIVKLGDMGMARNVYKKEQYLQTSSTRMPLAWMAPESLLDSVFAYKTDVWSFGVLMWEITSYARTPFGALGAQEIVAEVNAGRYLAQPAACNEWTWALIQRCWQVRPVARPSFTALQSELVARAQQEPHQLPQAEAGDTVA